MSRWWGRCPGSFNTACNFKFASYLPRIIIFLSGRATSNSVVDTLSSQCDPLTYLGVGLQSRFQLLWLCAVSKRHIKADYSGNSLKIAISSLRVKGEKKKSRHPTLYFLFQKTATLCTHMMLHHYLPVKMTKGRLTSVHIVHADDPVARLQQVSDCHRGRQPRRQGKTCKQWRAEKCCSWHASSPCGTCSSYLNSYTYSTLHRPKQPQLSPDSSS